MSQQVQMGDRPFPSQQMAGPSGAVADPDQVRDAMLEARRIRDIKHIAGTIQRSRNQAAQANVRWFTENRKTFA
jgi:hypothetical protein